MCRKSASSRRGVVSCHPVRWFVWAGDWAGEVLGCESGYRWNVVDRVKIKRSDCCVFSIFCAIFGERGQMKPLNILVLTIIEKERTGNEKGIERRRGIFGGGIMR